MTEKSIMVKKFIVSLLLSVFLLALFQAERCCAADDEPGDFYNYAEKYEEALKNSDKTSVSEFFGVSESEETDVSEEEYVDMLYSALPEEIRKELPSDSEEISYESYGFSYFGNKIKEALGSQLEPLGKIAVKILSLLLLTSLAERFCDGAKNETGRAFEALSLAALCVGVLNSGIFVPEMAGDFLISLSEVSNALLPTMTLLLCTTGNVTAAALTGQNAAIFSAVFQYLFSRVLYPLISACAGLCISGCVMGEKTAFSLSSFFRKTASFITVFIMTFFVFVMALQTTFTSAADGIGIKTVKFAAASFIPLVGGAVSETFNVVGAGLGYIKSTCGGISLAVILLILLPTVVSLLLRKLLYLLFSSLSGILGLNSAEKLFSELGGLNDCLLAACISVATLFIVLMIFVINCSVRIGGA